MQQRIRHTLFGLSDMCQKAEMNFWIEYNAEDAE